MNNNNQSPYNQRSFFYTLYDVANTHTHTITAKYKKMRKGERRKTSKINYIGSASEYGSTLQMSARVYPMHVRNTP